MLLERGCSFGDLIHTEINTSVSRTVSSFWGASRWFFRPERAEGHG